MWHYLADRDMGPRNTGVNTGELAKQPHGGALKRRGNYGNKGGGRPSNAVRGTLSEILEAGLPHLLEFATDTRARTTPIECPECDHEFEIKLSTVMPRDQLKAIEIAAKYGMVNESYDKGLVDRLWEATALVLEQVADGEKLAAEIQNGWVPILARKMMAST